MNWIKKKKNISKLNLILSLIGVLLIAAPFFLIWLLHFFDSKGDPDIVLFIGMMLMICSIPMIIVVATLYIFLIISSALTLHSNGDEGKIQNIIAISISILALTTCIVGTCRYFVIGSGLIDTISRLG